MRIENPRLLWQLTFEGAWPTAVTFLGSPRRLAAANQLGQIFVWELPETPPPETPAGERQAPDQPPRRRLDGHENGVTRLLATADGRTLVSSSLDHTVRLWRPDEPASGTAEAILDSETRRNRARRGRDDSPPAPGVAVETQGPTHTLAGHDDWVLSLAQDGEGRRLVSGDAAARVIAWELPGEQAKPRELVRWSGLPWNQIVALALDHAGGTAVVSEYRYKRDDFDIPAAALRVWDATTGEERLDILRAMFPKYKPDDSSYGAAQVWRKFVAQGLVAADISPDGTLLALAQGGETDTGKVELVELTTGTLVREVSGHQYGATDVRFSADGQLILSTGRDTTLRICRVADGQEVAALGKPRGGQFKDWLSALAIAPDQRTVAAADIAGLIHVWSLVGA